MQPENETQSGNAARSLRESLDEAYDIVDASTEVVGREVPAEARAWAEEHNLKVIESEFVPRGRLYLVGALPVDWTPSV